MTKSVLHGSFSSPKVDLSVNMGTPFLNRTVDGFLKIGAVAASRVLVDESHQCARKGSISKEDFDHALEKMVREGAYWGIVAGVYVGMEYSLEKICGTRDWKNATLGGALTGALVSAASNNRRDKVIKDAITAGAIATAAELIAHLT